MTEVPRAVTPKRGLALVELLIVLGIVGILAQLLVSAIQVARESSRREACQDNLRRIAIAVESYEHAHKTLPVGGYGCCGGTWMAAVLAYVEKPPMGDAYHFSGDYSQGCRFNSEVNLPITEHSFATFTCPSDVPTAVGFGKRLSDGDFPAYLSKHNYAANLGNTGYVTSAAVDNPPDQPPPVKEYVGVTFGGAPFYLQDGATDRPIAVKRGDIVDGATNTMLLAEVVQTQDEDMRAVIWWGYGAGFTTYLSPNSADPDVLQKEALPTRPWQSALRGATFGAAPDG